MLAELDNKKKTFEKERGSAEDVKMGEDGWVPSDAELKAWPLTQDGWDLMHDLAQKHGWEGHNSLKTDVKKKAAAKKACDSLIDKLKKWDPNTKAKRKKPEHKGIMAYQAKMISRLVNDRKKGLS